MRSPFRRALLVLLGSVTAFAAMAALQSPPAAVMRVQPRIHEIRLEVELFQQAPTGGNYGVFTDPTGQRRTYAKTEPTYRANGVSLGVPVLVRTSWCDTDFTKIGLRGSVDGKEYPVDPARAFQRAASGPQAVIRFDLPFERGVAETITTRVTYQVQRWELRVDEAAAAKVTWPREWDDGLDRFLRKEPGIDPTDARIKSLAEEATPGGPRSVGPYIAVRNAVAKFAKGWRVTNSGTSIYGQKGALRGINFTDGAWGLDAGGTPVELAAACTAAIRSLGVPARIVYCLQGKSSRSKSGSSGTSGCQFRMIGEFFIPDIGWIPFDPLLMRQTSGQTASSGSIKGFANVPDLHEALPLAHTLVPEGFVKADRFALWGWTGGVTVDEETAVTRIGFEDSSRGSGKTPSMPAPIRDDAR